MPNATSSQCVCRMIELVLGGARSGKSRYAEQQALNAGLNVVYVATAEAGDDEMSHRIQHHRQRRPAHWQTVEEPDNLAGVIHQYANDDTCLLIDCLTLWLSNVLFNRDGELTLERFHRHRDALLDALAQHRHRILMVSNEVGMGVVAIDAGTRRFVDEAGFLHQALAQSCDRVTWVVAGLPQRLK